MKITRWLAAHAAFAAVALACSSLQGCVDGAFSPAKTAEIIDAFSAPACTMLGVAVSDRVVGTVCQDSIDIVEEILRESDIVPERLPAPDQATYVPLRNGERIVGFVCSSVADPLRAGLEARRRDMHRGIAR